MFRTNDDVTTPDGAGVVQGTLDDGRVFVRLREKKNNKTGHYYKPEQLITIDLHRKATK